MSFTVLSLEQALTLPYATQRFVHLGWRVIRLESPFAPPTERILNFLRNRVNMGGRGFVSLRQARVLFVRLA